MFKQVLLLTALFGILSADDWVETKNVELGPNESVSSAYHDDTKRENVESYINITLNDEAQMHAKLNALSYKYDATLECDWPGGVVYYFDRNIAIRCYDKDEKELDGCSYTVDESDLIISSTSYSYNTGVMPVPADTKYIKVFTHASTDLS